MLTKLFSSLCVSAICVFSNASIAQDIQGAGSSAAAPLYQLWADAFGKAKGSKIAYQASGSSSGIRQIKEAKTDFGASDVALPASELKRHALLQFPSAISGVAVVYHLPGIKSQELRLTGDLLAQIFSGKITQWNDARLQSANPQLRLPAKAIEVLVREDGSGTTWNFSDYLSKVSTGWKAETGRDFVLRWQPHFRATKGSSGVAAALRKTPFSISYIDYNYVLQEKLDAAQLQNQDGKFVSPGGESFAAALNNSRWKAEGGFDETLTNQPGAKSWPITMGTFVILPQVTASPAQTRTALQFFTWAFMNGDRLVGAADFVRLPDAIQARIFRELNSVTTRDGKPLSFYQ